MQNMKCAVYIQAVESSENFCCESTFVLNIIFHYVYSLYVCVSLYEDIHVMQLHLSVALSNRLISRVGNKL